MIAEINAERALAFVPARGGSKSIPLKNIHPLADIPMIGYVLAAAQATPVFSRIVCSTDHPKINAVCKAMNIDVDPRPKDLCGDDVPVTDVVREFLKRQVLNDGMMAELVVLLQPTNPFVLPEHVDELVSRVLNDPIARSGQTVTTVSHNMHAYNQRVVEKGYVRFNFKQERSEAYNKQRKPHFLKFGNLVAVRSSAILEGADCFAEPSVAVPIDERYCVDVDGPDDVGYAEYLLRSGRVDLLERYAAYFDPLMHLADANA